MSDRTSVTLHVLKVDADKARATFNDSPAYTDTSDELLTEFGFDDVNYGNLPFLPKLLEAGIAYNSSWGSGDSYGPGTFSLRFTAEGNPVTWELYDETINPNLVDLMERIDKPVELRQYLLAHEAKTIEPTWDNQEEFSKIFRAKQLITPP